MGFYWNPYGITGTLALALAWTLAAVVYWTNPRRLQNRAFAVYLVLAGAGFGVGTGLMFFTGDVRTALALQAVSYACAMAYVPVYILFLSTLPTRVMAWARPRPVRGLLLVATAGLLLFATLGFHRFVAGVIAVPYARFDANFTPLGTRVFTVASLTGAALGILAAVGAWAESPRGSVLRRQARWYAATFLVWEVLQATTFVILTLAFAGPEPDLALFTLAAAVLFPGSALLFVVLLGYSILHTQLFDIDLKVKFAIRGTTFAAVFVAVFLIADQVVQALAGRLIGGLGGAVAAGLLLFAIQPLQRFAHRVANRAMPNTQDTPTYAQFRKMEVYKATVESFLVDGRITSRERDALSRLAVKLGIAASDARALEADLAPA